MTYMDNPPHRRWRTRLVRRPEDWTPEHDHESRYYDPQSYGR